MITVIIDTREQAPWSFPEHLVKSVRGTLKTGDYALESDSEFAIERKSLSDFLGTISSGWERFQREIQRMENFRSKIIIVEGTFSNVCFMYKDGQIITPQHQHYKLAPHFVCKRIAELCLNNVNVLFADVPDHASALAYQILKQRHEEIR